MDRLAVDRDTPVVEVRRRLAAVPEAVPRARALLRAAVVGTPNESRLEDGELALSELVTNALLHGRDPISLTLRVGPDSVRAEVCDGNPVSPSFTMLDQTAVTGRGLLLIGAVTDRWGVDPAPDGKAVWFELQIGGNVQERLDVDALLASWGDELGEDPAHEDVRVVLTDLDVELVARAEAQVEALLRELALVLTTDCGSPADRRTACRVLAAAAAVDPVRTDLRHQVSVAVTRGARRVDVTVTVRREHAEVVRDFAHVLDDADRLSRTGRLLTAPTPVELSHARRSYLRRVLAQLGS